MLIQRTFARKALPYVASLMLMTAACSSQPKTDYVLTEEPAAVFVKADKEAEKEVEKEERGFPWLNAIILAIMACVGGTMALGKYVDKKIDEQEAAKLKEKEISAKPENPQQ